MADRHPLRFDVRPGHKTETSYDGRAWSYTDRGIWKLVDTNVLIFNGGDAITVDRDGDAIVDTSFDMDKVPVAAEITESEA